eukprot:7380193-Prymnesium_polylepis.2
MPEIPVFLPNGSALDPISGLAVSAAESHADLARHDTAKLRLPPGPLQPPGPPRAPPSAPSPSVPACDEHASAPSDG